MGAPVPCFSMPDDGPVPESSPSPPPSSVPPSASTAPAGPAPPLTSRLGGKPGWTIVLAIAIALLLVLALLALGSPSSSSSGGSSAGVPFSSARSTGGSLAASAGGTWELLDASGLDLPNATTVPLSLSNISANCTVTFLGGGTLPSSLTIPRFTGNLTSGDSPEWELDYLEPATLSLIAVAVTEGSVALALEISGPHCLPSNASAEASIPAGVVDSTVAASAVAAAGATAFLTAHPNGVSLEMDLFPFTLGGLEPSGPGAPAWWFDFSTCPLLSASSNGTEPSGVTFDATVNATTGGLVPGSSTTGACGGSSTPPEGIGSALGFGIPTLERGPPGGTLGSQGCTSGDYCYSLEIIAASDGVTPGDFDVEVLSSSNNTLFPAVGYAITSVAGQVLVVENGSVEDQWSPVAGSSTTLLTAGMTLVVDMGRANPSAGQFLLELTGTGPFANSGEGISF